MTPKLNSTLHALLGETELMSQKGNLIAGMTKGRTESSKEMTDFEARELIAYLQSERGKMYVDRDKKRKKLIALAFSIGENTGFVIGWAEKYGVNGVKRKFNQYTKQELHLLIDKFQKTVIENRIKNSPKI
jgi:hypothetical protein